jgi:hypothetical protein
VEGCGMLWCLDLTYSTRSWCVWGEKLVTSCCVGVYSTWWEQQKVVLRSRYRKE